MQSEELRSVSRRASEAPITPITLPHLIGLSLFMSWQHAATWHLFICRHWRSGRRYIRQPLFQTTQGDSWCVASCRCKALTSACPPRPGAGLSARPWLTSPRRLPAISPLTMASGKSVAAVGGGVWVLVGGVKGHHKVSPATRN